MQHRFAVSRVKCRAKASKGGPATGKEVNLTAKEGRNIHVLVMKWCPRVFAPSLSLNGRCSWVPRVHALGRNACSAAGGVAVLLVLQRQKQGQPFRFSLSFLPRGTSCPPTARMLLPETWSNVLFCSSFPRLRVALVAVDFQGTSRDFVRYPTKCMKNEPLFRIVQSQPANCTFFSSFFPVYAFSCSLHRPPNHTIEESVPTTVQKDEVSPRLVRAGGGGCSGGEFARRSSAGSADSEGSICGLRDDFSGGFAVRERQGCAGMSRLQGEERDGLGYQGRSRRESAGTTSAAFWRGCLVLLVSVI